MACYRLGGGETSWYGRLLPTINRAISRINVRRMLSHDGFGFSRNDPHASAGGSALIQTNDLRWGDDAGGAGWVDSPVLVTASLVAAPPHGFGVVAQDAFVEMALFRDRGRR